MSRNPHRNNVSSKTIKPDTRGMFDFVEGLVETTKMITTCRVNKPVAHTKKQADIKYHK